MKKLLILPLVAVFFFLAACTKSPEDQIIANIEDATEQIKNCDSMEELESICDEMDRKNQEVLKGLSAKEIQELDNSSKIKEATLEATKVAFAKGMEFSSYDAY